MHFHSTTFYVRNLLRNVQFKLQTKIKIYLKQPDSDRMYLGLNQFHPNYRWFYWHRVKDLEIVQAHFINTFFDLKTKQIHSSHNLPNGVESRSIELDGTWRTINTSSTRFNSVFRLTSTFRSKKSKKMSQIKSKFFKLKFLKNNSNF